MVKSFKEWDSGQEQLLEQYLDEILGILDDEDLMEGRLGALVTSAAAFLRAKQSGFTNRISSEQDYQKKMELMSQQIASLSSLVLVILGAIAKDRNTVKSARRRG